MAKSFWSSDYSQEYWLEGECGSGGEGSTFRVEGHPDLVAKVYSEGGPHESMWVMQEKIFFMISRRSQLDLKVDEFGDEVDAVAWPVGALFDSGSSFAGFLMPKVSFAVSDGDLGITDLHCAYRPREQEQLFGDRKGWLMSIRIAANLAAVVQRLHENGIIIGDFNCNNILIDGQGHVTLIDADSFCVRNDRRQVTYRCVVGVDEFLAPEMQGARLAEPDERRMFTRESDCFSLAIHIFMLLMNGTHPFSGFKVGVEDKASSSVEPYRREIAMGECPYVTGSPLATFSNTLSVLRLPYYVRALIDRAFGYASPDGRIRKATIQARPSAREWHEALIKLHDECVASRLTCPEDKHHVNPPGSQTCMWCELDGRLIPLEMREEPQVDEAHDAGHESQVKIPTDRDDGGHNSEADDMLPHDGGQTRPELQGQRDASAQPQVREDEVETGSLVGIRYERARRALVQEENDAASDDGTVAGGSLTGIAQMLQDEAAQSPFRLSANPDDTQSEPAIPDAAEDCLRLGKDYYMGTGVRHDPEHAARLFAKAADKGYAEAQYLLGICHFYGFGVSQGDLRAYNCFRKAAAQGYAPAQHYLGICYDKGYGTPVDHQEAKRWYRLAAEQGYGDTQKVLGGYDRVVRDTERDRQSRQMLRKAAEQGDSLSQMRLGVLHYYGIGGPQNYREAATMVPPCRRPRQSAGTGLPATDCRENHRLTGTVPLVFD